jgi:tripartite-type tricarboxylate transporter receptor subunit TctC
MRWLVLGAGVALCALAQAQSWPARPVRFIVPFPPGGSTDVAARTVADKLSRSLGQQVLVENRGGGGGAIGTVEAARAAPDGYTLLFVADPVITLHLVVKNVAFEVRRDFAPVTQVTTQPIAVAVHAALPVRDVAELIAYAKANPGKLSFAHSGTGSGQHMSGELLKKMAGIDMVHVPYKGGAGPAVAGLVGGETHLMFVTASSAMNHVKSGRLRIIAVTSAKRLAAFPDTPTMAEAGYPQLTSGSWQGIFVPTGTPKEAVDKLYGVMIETMKTAEVQQRLANGGVEVVTSAPGEFAKFVARETERWGQAVREAGATAE